MPQLQDAHRMLDEAEQAANAGDLATADGLLRTAARLQEAELGPQHPELANTLNNLAIVAEKAGRIRDAETFYRRAASIAAATLPADHPMVVASRQNLEDFCHASGLPFDAATLLTPTSHETELGLAAFADEGEAREKSNASATANAAHASAAAPGAADTSAEAGTSAEAATAAGSQGQPVTSTPPRTTRKGRSPSPPTPARAVDPDVIGHRTAASPHEVTRPERSMRTWVVLGAIALAIAGFLAVRQMSRSASTVSPTRQTPPTQIVPETTPPSSAAPATTRPAGTPAAPSSSGATSDAAPPAAGQPAGSPSAATPGEATSSSPAVTASAGGVSLAIVELCRSFSTSGGAWRCDPAGESVAPGALVLYTRVRSPRDTAVVHRWYRGDALQVSAKLTIRANPSEGYRTFSRRTVGSGEQWRVEVTTANGELLHERRFVVR